MENVKKVYRPGAVGALFDEYERAVSELLNLLQPLSEQSYDRLMDPDTQDENCRSIQTVVSHVVSSGYSYADYVRERFSIPSTRPQKRLLLRAEAVPQIRMMMEYTLQTLEGRWEMTEEEIANMVMRTRWAVTYDMEQLLEHAIVHVLRHRRQIERFLDR